MKPLLVLVLVLAMLVPFGTFGQEVTGQQREIAIDGSPAKFVQSDLVILATDGSAEFRLTDTLAHEGHAGWSPDGSRVVFAGPKGGLNDLFVVNIDGSGMVNVTNTPDIGEIDPSWSPDSRRIIFAAGAWTVYQREGSKGVSRAVDFRNIFVINADGSGRRQLTDDESYNGSPRFSPNGQLVAFVSNRLGMGEIFWMNADGTSVRRITSSPPGSYSQSPSWSPTGLNLVYTRHQGSTSDIYTTDIGGNQTVQLTDTPDMEVDPAWSPSGKWIAFCRRTGAVQGLYYMRSDGTGVVRLGAEEDGRYTGPTWGPQELFIVAQTKREPGTPRDLTAYLLWDSGGLSIEMAGDDTPRFRGATRNPDNTITTRPLTDLEARGWHANFGIPFPELSTAETHKEPE